MSTKIVQVAACNKCSSVDVGLKEKRTFETWLEQDFKTNGSIVVSTCPYEYLLCAGCYDRLLPNCKLAFRYDDDLSWVKYVPAQLMEMLVDEWKASRKAMLDAMVKTIADQMVRVF
jgi:hypothetical protein